MSVKWGDLNPLTTPISLAVLQGIRKAVQAGEKTSSEEHVNINGEMWFEGRGTHSRERIGDRRGAQGVYQSSYHVLHTGQTLPLI